MTVQAAPADERLIGSVGKRGFMKIWLFLGLVCAASVACAEQEVKVGNQRLRVVLDARLTPEMLESEWVSGNPRTEPPATLELVGSAGQVLDRLTLAAPLAKIDPVPVRGAPYPTYLVSADLTREMGADNGPLTLPIQIVGDHLAAAAAQSTKQRSEPIHLAQTLRAEWKRVPNGKVENLLQVSCQPGNRGYVTYYRRYFLQSHHWKVKMRKRPGLWESEGNFPSQKLFP